ncbi:MAG TPA: tetratricopeptide repeat protein [Planctomycetota bacterium]|nr:tetratricopeptide repeat protein [Planctomycetota bacterium]
MTQAGIAWRKDVDAALDEARRDGRMAVVHVQLAGRPLSRAMAQETFADPGVAERSAAFVNVWVDLSARPELFERLIGGKGALGTAVLDGTGDVLSVLQGFAGPKAYVDFLQRAAAGAERLRAAREAAAKGPSERLALGDVYAELESPARAEACWRDVAAGGGVPAGQAHGRLARLQARRGRNLEARAHLAEARRLDPDGEGDRRALTEALALVLERKGAEARALLERALQRWPESPEGDQIRLALGHVRHELGDDRGATGVLEEALRRWPSSPWAAAIRQKLDHIKNPPQDHEH